MRSTKTGASLWETQVDTPRRERPGGARRDLHRVRRSLRLRPRGDERAHQQPLLRARPRHRGRHRRVPRAGPAMPWGASGPSSGRRPWTTPAAASTSRAVAAGPQRAVVPRAGSGFRRAPPGVGAATVGFDVDGSPVLRGGRLYVVDNSAATLPGRSGRTPASADTAARRPGRLGAVEGVPLPRPEERRPVRGHRHDGQRRLTDTGAALNNKWTSDHARPALDRPAPARDQRPVRGRPQLFREHASILRIDTATDCRRATCRSRADPPPSAPRRSTSATRRDSRGQRARHPVRRAVAVLGGPMPLLALLLLAAQVGGTTPEAVPSPTRSYPVCVGVRVTASDRALPPKNLTFSSRETLDLLFQPADAAGPAGRAPDAAQGLTPGGFLYQVITVPFRRRGLRRRRRAAGVHRKRAASGPPTRRRPASVPGLPAAARGRSGSCPHPGDATTRRLRAPRAPAGGGDLDHPELALRDAGPCSRTSTVRRSPAGRPPEFTIRD